MTAHQLKGRAFHLTGNFQDAEAHLIKAHDLSSAFPFANSGFVAKAYLVHLYAELKQKAYAEKFLNIIDAIVNSEISDDLWISRKLIGLRARSHFERAFGTIETLKETLYGALALAQHLDDVYMINKCEEDLQKCGAEVTANKIIKNFTSWSYIPKFQLLLKEFPKEIVRLGDNPVMTEILNQLMDGPKDQIKLFEAVWKIPFNERHANHLRALFSKLRKFLPQGALKVQNGIAKLI
jgi:hypothetical protein